MAGEEENLVLGVETNLGGLDALVAGLAEILPAIRNIGQQLDATQLGSIPDFERRGELLAQSFKDALGKGLATAVDTSDSKRIAEGLLGSPADFQRVVENGKAAIQDLRRAVESAGLQEQVGLTGSNGGDGTAQIRAVTTALDAAEKAYANLNAQAELFRRQQQAVAAGGAELAPKPAAPGQPLSRAGNVAQGLLRSSTVDPATVEAGLRQLGFSKAQSTQGVQEALTALGRLPAAVERVERAAGAAGGSGGGSGPRTAAGAAGDGGEEERVARLLRTLQTTGQPHATEDDILNNLRARQLSGDVGSYASEDARQAVKGAPSYEAAFIESVNKMTLAMQRSAQSLASNEAKVDAQGRVLDRAGLPNTAEERQRLLAAQAGNSQERTLTNALTVARKTDLTSYLNSSAPLDQKFFASLRGAAPGQQAPGFVQDFKQGFLGTNPDIAAQLGQTAKFSVFYGAAYAGLYKVTQGLQAVTQAAIDYQTSLVDLERVTGQGAAGNQALAASGANAARNNGIAPNEGITLTGQAIGLYDLFGKSTQQQIDVTSVATKVAAQLSATTGQTPDAVAQNIAGLVRSFSLSKYGGQQTAQDTVTAIARRSGVDLGGLLNATSDIGTLGAQAGFDLPGLAAAIARISSTVGTAPSTAAGSLRAVLSKANDPTIIAALQGVGVDTNGTTLAQQIKQLSGLGLSPDAENQIIQKFGRGASGQALGILLNQAPQVQSLANAGAQGQGAGQRDFNIYINSIGGQLRELGVNFKALAQDLSQTGVLDVLGALVKVLNLTVRAADDVVQVFNTIPRPLRTATAAMAELTIAATLFSRSGLAGAGVMQRILGVLSQNVGGGFLGRARGASGVLAAGEREVVDAFGQRQIVSAAEGAAAQGGGGFVGRLLGGRGVATGGVEAAEGGVGAALAKSFPTFAGALSGISAALPAIAGIGGAAIIAFGIAHNLIGQGQATQRAISRANGAVDSAISTQGLSAAADSQTNIIRATLQQQSLSFSNLGLGAVFNRLGSSNASQEQALARRNRTYLQGQSTIVAGADAARAQLDPTAVFGAFQSLDAVNNGLKTLATEGLGAKEQLDALTRAFGNYIGVATGSGVPSGTVAQIGQGGGTQFSVATTAAGFAARDSVVKQLRDTADAAVNRAASGGSRAPGAAGAIDNRAADALAKIPLDQLNGVGEAALSALAARGKNPATGVANLSDADLKAATDAATAQLETSLGSAYTSLDAAAKKQLVDSFVTNLRKNLTKNFQVADQTISAAQVQSVTQAVIAGAPGAGQQVAVESGQAAKGSKYTLDQLRAQRAQDVKALDANSADPKQQFLIQQQINQLDDQIDQYQDQYAGDQANVLQAAAQAKANKLNPGDKVGREAISLTALKAELKNYRKGSDPYVALANEIAQAQSQYAEDAAQQADALKDAHRTLATDPGNSLATAQNAVKAANEQVAYQRQFGSPADVANAQVAAQQARYAAQQAQVAQDGARRLAVISPDASVAQARAQVANAKEALDATQKGDQAYYEALAAYKSSELNLATAIAANAANVRKLNIDLTNPVQVAQEELREAQIAYRNAKSPAARNAAGVTVAQDTTGLAQARFTQNLSDIQTAQSLGRISQQQYIAYLDSQRDVLQHQIAGMKTTSNGYRQAVDDLNQIDGLIQAASQQAVSQFNIGNIDLPTAYQVRRAVASGLPVSQGAYGSTTINIDGANTDALIQWLSTQLGAGATVVRTTGNGRKV